MQANTERLCLMNWLFESYADGLSTMSYYLATLRFKEHQNMITASADNNHIRHEILVCGISNTLFNGMAAWLLMKNVPELRWGTDDSFAVDILATGLLLPLIVALLVIPMQRSKLNKGKLQPIHLGASSFIQSFADRFPSSTFKSAGLFGLIGMLVYAPLTLAGFFLLGVDTISPVHYAIFKGLWAGLIAAVLVVPMVLIALRKPESITVKTA